MNFKRFTTVLRAGAFAALFVVGTSGKANAALLIDFDNSVFDGGQIVPTAGGNYTGTGIIFDSIYLKDTTGGPGGTSLTLGGVQCGVATTSAAALPADTCKLNFNTATGAFAVVSPTGLWGIGADLLPYTADRGGLLAGTAGANVLTGTFQSFSNTTGPGGVFSLFVGAGMDTKNPSLLAFFGLPADSTFTFGNTAIYTNANGQVNEADLTNVVNPVPEPATMMLLGTGLLAAFRARRKAGIQ